MDQASHEEPFSESHLQSPEYRERLMRKLNCLIAVLEVATAKIKQTMATPEADVERLGRIRTNLQSTLEVCQRARAALERRDGTLRSGPVDLAQAVQEEGSGATPRRHAPRGSSPLETSSETERARFENLPPIDLAELRDVDLDELMRRLQG
jgi:hypothetical protein